MEGGILAWIVFGLIAGVIAKLLMPGSDPGGCIITMLLGVAGALLGGFLGRAIGIYSPGEPAGIIMAVLGAIVILVGYRMVLRPST
ncbi:MAG: GlsB/YeaQ/YmgE family stress response membrane protein [Vicinamibacteria bacterium]